MIWKVLLAATALTALGGVGAVARQAPPAPNVLIIMTDDVGFSASSTFGGEIPTPALDGLARVDLASPQFSHNLDLFPY